MAERQAGRNPWARGRALLGAFAAVALAACAVVPHGRPEAPPPVTAPIAPPPSTGSLPADQARHRVALLVPLSGPNAAVGQSLANAANLALLDTGATGIRMSSYDTATGAAAAAERAIADGNQLFLGPLLGEDVRAVAAVARRSQVPVVAFSNDAAVAGDGAFLMGFSPAQSIERVVRYAKSRGLTRFAALIPAGQYGRTASAVMLRAVEAAGGTVAAMASYDRSASSIAAAARKLPAGKFDAVLIADGGRIAIQAAPLVHKGNAGARILGTELWATDAAIGASPALAGAWYASVPDGLYRQLATKYRARYGKGPYRLASLGYDAVLLTIRISSDWKLGAAFPTWSLTDKDGFGGVDGAFRFGRDGIAERQLEVTQIGPRGGAVVSPAAKGF